MTENVLIGALERAIEQTKATLSTDEAESEIFSKQLVRELDQLSKPRDPTKSLSPLEFWLHATVANVTFDQSELERLERLYELLVISGASVDVEGAIGFLLCCRSADQAQSLKTGRSSQASNETIERVETALVKSNKFLANVAVRNWIATYYAIDKVGILDQRANATMIASGTTSYVVRFTGAADFVLKLVKPQFRGSNLIRDQTASYADRLRAQASSNPFLPRVYAAGSSYLQMEFISGKSLADMMELGILDGMSTEERRELIFGIIGNLEALDSPHLDLSPGNIMIENLSVGGDGGRRFKVRLIDFGYNYLLREGLSGLPIRNDIVRYCAPEMMAGAYEGSVKADLYSLGMIILDVMRSSPNAVDLSVQLDRCWQAHPQLAAIAEELIVREPIDRARWSNGLDQPNTYRAFRRRLKQEEQVTKLIDARVKVSDAWGALEGPFREVKRVVREFPTLRRLTEDDADSADARYLYIWSGVINVFLAASYAVCGYMLLQTLGLNNIDKWPPSAWANSMSVAFEKLRSLLFGAPEGQAVLAGQAMALTIILVVSQYYNGIFSPITTRSSRIRRFARKAEVTIRLTPFGIMLLCVSTAVWFPARWYITSLIGPLITAINNYYVWRFCQSVRQEMGRNISIGNLETTDISRFDETFQRWPRAMAVAGVQIFLVGLLLRFGIIGNEALLVLAMAWLCYSSLYKSASTDMSALVRGGIRRYVRVAEQVQPP